MPELHANAGARLSFTQAAAFVRWKEKWPAKRMIPSTGTQSHFASEPLHLAVRKSTNFSLRACRRGRLVMARRQGERRCKQKAGQLFLKSALWVGTIYTLLAGQDLLFIPVLKFDNFPNLRPRVPSIFVNPCLKRAPKLVNFISFYRFVLWAPGVPVCCRA